MSLFDRIYTVLLTGSDSILTVVIFSIMVVINHSFYLLKLIYLRVLTSFRVKINTFKIFILNPNVFVAL